MVLLTVIDCLFAVAKVFHCPAKEHVATCLISSYSCIVYMRYYVLTAKAEGGRGLYVRGRKGGRERALSFNIPSSFSLLPLTFHPISHPTYTVGVR